MTTTQPTTKTKPTDFELILGEIIADALKSKQIELKLWQQTRLDTAFPSQKNLSDLLGYATTLDSEDMLIKYGTGSFNHIYVDELRGNNSAYALSGLRTAFNTKAQDENIPLRLYLLTMPRKSCDVVGGLVTTFEYYNLFLDLKPMLKPNIDPDDTKGIGIPKFIYLNNSNLALPFHGYSKPEDTLSTTVEYLLRGYNQLLELEKKYNPTENHKENN